MNVSPFSLTRVLLAALPAEATHADRLVACLLASYASSTGELWAHNRTIARLCGLDMRSVRRCVMRLEEWGVLARPGRKDSGATAPAMRRIILPGIDLEDGDEGAPEADSRVRTPGLQCPPSQDSRVLGTQDSRVPPRKRTTKDKQPLEQTPQTPRGGLCRSLPLAARDSRFDDFYRAYPRHVGRGQAERAWKTALRAGVKPSEIIDGLQAQLSALRDQDPRYVPHPATWLNGKRWLDEPPESTGDALRRIADEMTLELHAGAAL